MRRVVWAGLLAGVLACGGMCAWAQDGTAVQEQQGKSGAVLDGPNPNAGDDQPKDPNVGSVTHLKLPRFVTLKGNEGNARRGPGLTHRIDWVFTREGMPLKITAEYEHWRRVEDADGAGGWVHYSLLSGVRSVLISQDMAQAFSQPDEKSDVLYQSELGVIGKLLQCIPDWCRISVEGEKGWLHKSALWGVDKAEIYP
jgi:SH3-like domain-containing protein